MSKRIERYKKYSNYERLKEGPLCFDAVISGLKLVSYDIEHVYADYKNAVELINGAIEHINEGWTIEELKVYLIEGRKK